MQQSAMPKSAMQEQLKFQEERDTRRQIKEDAPRIAINSFGIKWSWFQVYVEGIRYTAMMEVAMIEGILIKLVENAGTVINKVVYSTEEAKFMVYMVELQEQIILKDWRDTREDTKKREVFCSFRKIESYLEGGWR
jgi:hypothetical protein